MALRSTLGLRHTAKGMAPCTNIVGGLAINEAYCYFPGMNNEIICTNEAFVDSGIQITADYGRLLLMKPKLALDMQVIC